MELALPPNTVGIGSELSPLERELLTSVMVAHSSLWCSTGAF